MSPEPRGALKQLNKRCKEMLESVAFLSVSVFSLHFVSFKSQVKEKKKHCTQKGLMKGNICFVQLLQALYFCRSKGFRKAIKLSLGVMVSSLVLFLVTVFSVKPIMRSEYLFLITNRTDSESFLLLLKISDKIIRKVLFFWQ